MNGSRSQPVGLPWAGVAALVAVLAAGVAAYVHQLAAGDIVTSMRTLGAGGVVWGLYIVMDGCCLGAGVALMACACLARFSRDRDLEAVARIAMPAALTCFLAAALSVMADQGRPAAALWHLATVARPQSPLFATATSVGAICLFGSLVHCVLARRADLAVYATRASFWRPLQRLLAAGYRGTPGQRHRRRQVGLWMSVFMLAALLVPLAALAIAFTVRPGRPWFVAACEAVAFTFCAGTGGLAVLVVAAILVGRLAGPSAGLSPRGLARVGRGLLLALALAALTVVLAVGAAAPSSDRWTSAWATALVAGTYAPLFWLQVALLILSAGALWWAGWRGRWRPRLLVGASLGAGVAVFLHGYLALIPWQTHGLPLPYPPGAYAPSPTEIGVAAGIVALSLLLLLPSVRLIPFAPVADDAAPSQPPVTDVRRLVLTALWGLGGLGLAAVGLALSLRVGTEPFLDPRVKGSPTLFVAGLVMLVLTGPLYELLPEPKRAGDASAGAAAAGPRPA